MTGRARSGAAISVLNALFDGVGAALGIDLAVEAEVDRDDGAGAHDAIRPASSATPLVRATLDRARAEYAPGRAGPVRLTIRSEVPAAVGLKSSSAVGTAVALAYARAVGERPEPAAVARLAAETARAVGQSATGAFDDALASLLPGLWMADTRHATVLLHRPGPSGELLLWIPPGTHRPSPTILPRLEGRGDPSARARLEADDLEGAMEANSEALERALGLPSVGREELRGGGARAVAVSGLGPAVAVLAPAPQLPELRAILSKRPGRLLVSRFRPPGPPEGGS